MNAAQATDFDVCVRQADRLYELLGRAWGLHILALLARKSMHDTELLETLHAVQLTGEWPAARPRLGAEVLRETLAALVDGGLVTCCLDDASLATRYALTLTGEELVYALRPALLWAARHPDVIEPITRSPRAGIGIQRESETR